VHFNPKNRTGRCPISRWVFWLKTSIALATTRSVLFLNTFDGLNAHAVVGGTAETPKNKMGSTPFCF
jgi:hypothetical protein